MGGSTKRGPRRHLRRFFGGACAATHFILQCIDALPRPRRSGRRRSTFFSPQTLSFVRFVTVVVIGSIIALDSHGEVVILFPMIGTAIHTVVDSAEFASAQALSPRGIRPILLRLSSEVCSATITYVD